MHNHDLISRKPANRVQLKLHISGYLNLIFNNRVKQWLKAHMHWSPRDQQKHLSLMLRGFYQYFGLYHCTPKLRHVQLEVQRQWARSLRGRSQRSRLTWNVLNSRPWFQLPYPQVVHRTV